MESYLQSPQDQGLCSHAIEFMNKVLSVGVFAADKSYTKMAGGGGE